MLFADTVEDALEYINEEFLGSIPGGGHLF